MYPEFSVITLTWNRPETLRKSLPALVDRTPWDKGELILIEQGSTDETWKYIRSKIFGVPQVKILRNRENVGIPRGWNLGLRIAEGSMLVCIGSDFIVPEGWISELRQLLSFPKAGCVSIPSDELLERKDLCSDEVTVAENGIRARMALGNTGVMMCFTRETHLRLGYFNEEYGFYGEEDADWGARVSLSGLLNLYSADMKATGVAPDDNVATNSVKAEGLERRRRLIVERITEYSVGQRSCYIGYHRDRNSQVPKRVLQ